MNAPKHTPAPWRINAYYTDNGTPGAGNPAGIAGVNGNIADLYRRNPNAEADARLIAASPEMLEALRFVREFYQRNFDMMPVAFQTADHIVEQAIMKAEG